MANEEPKANEQPKVANEWQWAECILEHGRRPSKDEIKTGLETQFQAESDIAKLLKECLSSQQLADSDIVKQADNLANTMRYAAIIGADVRAFAVIHDQQTEIFLACSSGDIINQVDNHLPQLRDGVYHGKMPKGFKWFSKLPWIRKHLFWPGLQGVVTIRASAFGAKVPVLGRTTPLLSIFDAAVLSGLVAGFLIGILTLLLDDNRHWALSLAPLWVGLIAAGFKTLFNSGQLFLKRLEWIVSK